jgi:CubicO group peptidase (beta-lactamase class C family)
MTYRNTALAWALAAATVAEPTAGQPSHGGGASREPFPGLDAYVTRALATWHVPGAALAIVRHDSVIYAHGYGVRTVGSPTPVDDQTIFAIGSCTKAFTSTGIAMLVDDGKLRWDDRVTTYLPDFQLSDPYVTRELTVRDLLTHRSGVARGEMLWYYSGLDRSEILHRARFLKQATSFRSGFGYHNIMYLAAGQTLAAAGGLSWDEFIQRRILTPLGMTSTSTSITALAGHDNVASPHSGEGGTLRVVPWYNIDNIAPAGSINSNARDMAQWLRLQLGHGQFAGKTLVSTAALDETRRPQTIIPVGGGTEALFPSTHFMNYGMGWLLYDYRGHVAVEHTGGIDGFRSLVTMLPDDDFGFVLLTNEGSTVVYDAIRSWLFDRQLGAPMRDWSTDMHRHIQTLAAREDSATAREEARRVTGTHPTLALERYAGTYRDSAYGIATVRVENGALVLTRGTLVGTLEHWNYDTFRAIWRAGVIEKSLLTFRIDDAGAVGSVAVEFGGDPVIFTRVAPAAGAAAAGAA